MKTAYRIFLISCACLLSACINDDEPDNDINIYEQEFCEKLITPAKGCSWTCAARHSVNVEPRNNKEIKVYSEINNKYSLVAHYTKAKGLTNIEFDAPDVASQFVVEVGPHFYLVDDGGTVDANSNNYIRDIDISGDPFNWILVVENDFDAKNKRQRKGDEIDFDFNDVVLKISTVEKDNEVELSIWPLAVGDNQKIYMHLIYDKADIILWPDDDTGRDDCELHQWLGVLDHATRVNTGALYDSNGEEIIYNYNGGWASQTSVAKKTSGCTMSLPKLFSLANFSNCYTDYAGNIISYTGLYFTVGTHRSAKYIANDPDYKVIINNNSSTVPNMLLFPDAGLNGLWNWTREGVSIAEAYISFVDWLKFPSNEIYRGWYMLGTNSNELVFTARTD